MVKNFTSFCFTVIIIFSLTACSDEFLTEGAPSSVAVKKESTASVLSETVSSENSSRPTTERDTSVAAYWMGATLGELSAAFPDGKLDDRGEYGYFTSGTFEFAIADTDDNGKVTDPDRTGTIVIRGNAYATKLFRNGLTSDEVLAILQDHPEFQFTKDSTEIESSPPYNNVSITDNQYDYTYVWETSFNDPSEYIIITPNIFKD